MTKPVPMKLNTQIAEHAYTRSISAYHNYLLVLSIILSAIAFHSCHPVVETSPTMLPSCTGDSVVYITDASDLKRRRDLLIKFIWDTNGLPADMPSSVKRNIFPSDTTNPGLAAQDIINLIKNLRGHILRPRIDELKIGLDNNSVSWCYHIIPPHPNNHLVIMHSGHACFNDGYYSSLYGQTPVIKELLSRGYSVLLIYMPCRIITPNSCGIDQNCHKSMFSNAISKGNPLKYFLQPAIECINYLQSKAMSIRDSFPNYNDDYSMIGLSGGGWTTTIYAAIDSRIKLSIPIAGSLPLYITGPNYGDPEQNLCTFYSICGYPDLYTMGSYGQGRKQIQVLNKNENVFPVNTHLRIKQVNDYTNKVESALQKRLNGLGTFTLFIDPGDKHMITANTRDNIILPNLPR